MDADDRKLLRAVARRIAELRAERGWTQEVFAERYGASVKYTQALELGTENLSLTTLARVAKALKIPVRDLFVAPQSMAANPGRPKRKAVVAKAPKAASKKAT